jgi:nicotinic acid mononucleotide adenylyltransferase
VTSGVGHRRKPTEASPKSVAERATPESWRAALAKIAARSEPAALLLTPGTPAGSLAVVPGAYNPPTRAHVALARSARGHGFENVFFSLGTVTIDKPQSGLRPEERLHLLVQVAACEPGCGVVLVNRGLYAEQAEALRRSFPEIERLAFVVGMDKVAQIFDERYYLDRDRALGALFERAGLLVAARGALDRSSLRRLLDKPPASSFARHIEWLDVDPEVRDVSATAVRERLARGDRASEWLPPPVERYLRARGSIFGQGRTRETRVTT